MKRNVVIPVLSIFAVFVILLIKEELSSKFNKSPVYIPYVENSGSDHIKPTKKQPQKYVIEEKFCLRGNIKKVDIPTEWKNKCPDKPVVTARQQGRLGNQLWQYASVWAVAKFTNREPFLPSCSIDRLKNIFKNFTRITPLKYIEECPIHYQELVNKAAVGTTNGSIILPPYAMHPEYVVPHLKEVLQLFQFQDHITKKSQDILRKASERRINPVYVAVHVRRTDYKQYLKWKVNSSLLTEDYFYRQMDYFRQKYLNPLFIVVSDDPIWCKSKFYFNDVVVTWGNSPEQDLSVMANCNHSILDYGTFGLWGAMMAGGETLLYNISLSLEQKMSRIMPKWKLVA